ncbi:MAG: GrpB family protein [Microcystaceae cyanobacterium]
MTTPRGHKDLSLRKRLSSRAIRDNLLLRDYLRSQPGARHCYEQHKQAIIKAGSSQLLAYSEQKAQVVSDLFKQAQ